MSYTLEELRQRVAPIAQKYGVERVSVSGSYGKMNPSEHSDLDLKIDKGAIRTLFQLCDFRLAIEDELQLPIDIVTSDISDQQFLNHISKDEVIVV